MNFQFLNSTQYKALTPDAKKEYDEALAAYLTEFAERADDNGIVEVNARIVRLSPTPNFKTGKPIVSMVVEVEDEMFAGNVNGGESGVIRLPLGQADVIAQNSGFGNWAHMAVSTLSCINKGSFTLSVTANVAGEAWEGRKNGKRTSGTFKHTHLATRQFEFEPSAEVIGVISKATSAVAAQGYADMLKPATAPTTPTPVAQEEEEPVNA